MVRAQKAGNKIVFKLRCTCYQYLTKLIIEFCHFENVLLTGVSLQKKPHNEEYFIGYHDNTYMYKVTELSSEYEVEPFVSCILRWNGTPPYCDIFPIEINNKIGYNFFLPNSFILHHSTIGQRVNYESRSHEFKS